MRRFRHIPTPPMRNFLQLLDSCAHIALCTERKRDEAKQVVAAGDDDRALQRVRPERLTFGKAFGDEWRRTFQKWYQVPAVNVAPYKFYQFCRKVLQGRIPDHKLGELKAAHKFYLSELIRLDSFDQGRVHWIVKSARKALAKTIAAEYLDDLQRDADVVRYVADMLISGARQAGENADAISYLTALMTLVGSSKSFNDVDRSRALYELARMGSVLSYQVGNTQVLTWCQVLTTEAENLHSDAAHESLHLMIRHFQAGLECPDAPDFRHTAIEALRAIEEGGTRYELRDNLDLWLAHNAMVPLVRARADRDVNVPYHGSSTSIERALPDIASAMEERGQLHAAALVASTHARALAHWEEIDAARSVLMSFSLKLQMASSPQPHVAGCLAETTGDIEYRTARKHGKLEVALHHARLHWSNAIDHYQRAGSFQRHGRVARKLAAAMSEFSATAPALQGAR